MDKAKTCKLKSKSNDFNSYTDVFSSVIMHGVIINEIIAKRII